jgi:Flp pilus assembly protein TadG
MTRRTHGQSIVEMALVLPFLVLVIFGIIELGYYVYIHSELENATRRASERASKTPPFVANDPDDQCLQLIIGEALSGVTLSNLTSQNFSVTFVNNMPRSPGNEIQVDLSYTGQFLTPIGQRFFGNTLNFAFTSRRTIISITPPSGYNYDCSPQ